MGNLASSRSVAIRLSRLTPRRCWPSTTPSSTAGGVQRRRQAGQFLAMKTCSVTCTGTTGKLDDFPGALDPAASQVRPAIGTALHHVLHPMGRCHAPAGEAVAVAACGAAAALAAGGPNWTLGRAFGVGHPIWPGLPVRQSAAATAQSPPVTRR